MFDDERNKHVVFVAHCILNQNAISDGTAYYPGSIERVIYVLIRSGVGIVQMPCPELICLGLDRGNKDGSKSPVVRENTRIRKMMGVEPVKSKLDQQAQHIIFQIKEYQKFNFDVLGIVGMNRSPSCGVDTTSKKSREVKGKGLFIEALETELEKNHIHLPIIGISASKIDEAVNSIKKMLSEAKILNLA